MVRQARLNMSRIQERELFSLSELQAKRPDAYAKVLRRWEDAFDDCGEIPWSEETMDSLRAVVKACGARLVDWSIGAYMASHVTVECDDEYEDDDGETHPKDSAWLMREVLAPNGYAKDGKPDFPGHCKWTGYCADDDMIEAASKAMDDGESLSDALNGLADVARQHFEDDLEQARNEESMHANWGDREYDEDGRDA